MALAHQRREVAHEQRTDQRRNMQTIGIRIRKDTDLAIAQLAQVIGTWLNAEGHGDVMNFCRAQHLTGIDLPGIHDLAAQWHDRLEFAAARLLGGTTGGIPFHQEQFRLRRIIAGTVGQLAGQCRAGGDFLAHHFLRRTQTFLCVADAQLGEAFRFVGVLVQPQRERILDHAGNKRRGLA